MNSRVIIQFLRLIQKIISKSFHVVQYNLSSPLLSNEKWCCTCTLLIHPLSSMNLSSLSWLSLTLNKLSILFLNFFSNSPSTLLSTQLSGKLHHTKHFIHCWIGEKKEKKAEKSQILLPNSTQPKHIAQHKFNTKTLNISSVENPLYLFDRNESFIQSKHHQALAQNTNSPPWNNRILFFRFHTTREDIFWRWILDRKRYLLSIYH